MLALQREGHVTMLILTQVWRRGGIIYPRVRLKRGADEKGEALREVHDGSVRLRMARLRRPNVSFLGKDIPGAVRNHCLHAVRRTGAAKRHESYSERDAKVPVTMAPGV